jgi:hypothetical protein
MGLPPFAGAADRLPGDVRRRMVREQAQVQKAHE